MATSGGDKAEQVGRETRWLFVRLFLTTFPPLALLSGILGAVLFETVARLSIEVIPGLVGTAAALSAVHAGTELSTYPNRVTMRPATLALSYPKFEIEAPWEDWTPIGRSRMTGGLAFRTRWGSPRGYLVTPGQARQIYRFSSRPAWANGSEAPPAARSDPPPAR